MDGSLEVGRVGLRRESRDGEGKGREVLGREMGEGGWLLRHRYGYTTQLTRDGLDRREDKRNAAMVDQGRGT